MSKELISRYAERIGRCIDQVNPHEDAHTRVLFELGLLRSILAQCILNDNRNEWIFDRVLESIVEKYQRKE